RSAPTLALGDRDPEARGPPEQHRPGFLENEGGRMIAIGGGGSRENWSATVDLPVPGGPINSVDVPRSIPPPRSLSSSATPLPRLSRSKLARCSDAVRRGKTSRPPGRIRKSW